MATVAVFIFSVFTHFLVLYSAESCPDFFCNPIVGKISFPFKNKTQDSPECGYYTVDCSDQPSPKIQLKKEGYWFQFASITQSASVLINDSKLQERIERLRGDSCDDDVFSDLSLPNSPPIVHTHTDNLTLFRCNNTLDKTPYEDPNYACRSVKYIYYTVSNDSLACSAIQIPIHSPSHSNVYNRSALTATFYLQVPFTEECVHCYTTGGKCLDDYGQFKCSRPQQDKCWKEKRQFNCSLAEEGKCQDEKEEGKCAKAGKHLAVKLGLGKLKDGREVAVKRLYEHNYKRVEQFMNEIEILTRLRHKNLVSLYGCTSRRSRELILVYEYIPNGTVADHLHGDLAERGPLTWPIRMSIAIETANALSCLHVSDIVHRDVKTTNILLDNNFCVKVADFGVSRLFPLDVTHVSTAPQGTPGYVDPEYHQCYQLTSKSDVYSFGVVLIELISSLPAVDITRHRHEINLSNIAINKIQRGLYSELVDSCLGFESDHEVKRMIIAVAELAFQCLQQDNDARPTMSEVLETLQMIESGKDVPENLKEDFGDVEMKKSIQPPPSPECDELQLLKNMRPPFSPISVTQNWPSTRKESVVSMLCARGTAGYIAPEVFCRNFAGVSHKSDVYSYGMMLSEMVGGRRDINVEAEDTSDIYFPHWIYKRLEQDEELGLQCVTNEEDKARARKMIIVSLWCIQTDPSNRPAMKEVIEMLEGSVESLQIPPKPYLSSPSKSPAVVDSSTTLVSI